MAEEDLPLKVLHVLDKEEQFDSLELASKWNITHQKLMGAIHSLLTNEGVILI
jgi:hypothetical protein